MKVGASILSPAGVWINVLFRFGRQIGRGASHPARNIVLSGAFLIGVLIVGATSMVLDRRASDLAAAEHEIDSLSLALTEQTSLAFGAVDFALHSLRDRIAAAGVASPEALAATMGTAEVHHMLRDVVAGLSQMDVISIVGVDGRIINYSRKWPVSDTVLLERDFFYTLRDDRSIDVFIGKPVRSRETGRELIYMARPITAPDHTFLGIVVGAVRINYFGNLYRAVSAGDGRVVGLQRRDGVMLARYPEPAHPITAIPAGDATVADIQRGAPTSRSVTRSPIDGRVMLRIARALVDFPLVVVVGQTEASILQGWQRQTGAVAGGAGLAVLMVMVTIALLARQTTRLKTSERALAATLDHMSQGIAMIDADRRVQVYNRRTCEMLDLPPELMATKPLLDDIVELQWKRGEFGPDGASLDATIRPFIQSGAISDTRHSYERCRPDGTMLEISSIPLTGGGLVRTYTDITAARLREASLQAALSERDEAEKALQQHGENLEHELAARTQPLAASEARHRDMAEVSSDWIWEIDTTLCLTFISKRFGDTSGIPWAQVTGRPLSVLVELGFDPGGMKDLRAAVDARRSFHDAVHRIDLASGEARFWILSGKPFFDPVTGAYAGYRGTGTDVTVRIEREAALNAAVLRAEAAERAVRRASSRLIEAIEAIPEGFALHDAEDRLVLCNARYGELYQLDAEAMTPGALLEDTVRMMVMSSGPTLDKREVETLVAERLVRHRTVEGNHEVQRVANGRWLEVHERRTSDGGTVGIQVDVTEARQRETAERDRERLAALGQLAGGVAHEINNLLQPALTLPEMVRDRLPADDIESREDLDCVIESAGKMRDIVRNILLFARKEEPRLAMLDLVAEVRAALGFVSDLMPPAVTIREQNLDSHLGCMVAANKTQLTQVLTNLLVNAAQATTGLGTVTVSVDRTEPTPEEAATLSIEAGRSYLAVSVADTGSGMDEATRARIFEPFFTTKPIGQGTGLGLSVAYGILRSWQGAIAVQSAVGQGTTFVLYVPLVNPANT